jgi:ElaA protein
VLHDRPLVEVDPVTLYRILMLRSSVFVVEQACAYLDLDGRDLEPTCRLLWIDDDSDDDSGTVVLATARVLDDGDARRIGRIVTAPAARGRGLAAELLAHAVATSDGPWVLDAQAHLADWYARFGFAVDGPTYVEDGIPHVPMKRTGDG